LLNFEISVDLEYKVRFRFDGFIRMLNCAQASAEHEIVQGHET